MRHPPTRSRSSERRRRAFLVLAAGGLVGAGALGVAGRMQLLRLFSTARVVAGGGQFLGREGVHLQQTLHDCGPAALATLFSVSGRSSPTLAALRTLAGTTVAGTTAAGLIAAADASGFPLHFQRLPALPPPEGGFFIAWIRSSHFVVVRALPDDRVLVLDPQVGRYLVTRDRFRGIWSGEALLPVGAEARLTPPAEPDSSAGTIATGRLP